MSIYSQNDAYDYSFIEVMQYLTNKLESRYNSILKFKKLIDTSDSPNSFFSLRKDLKQLFSDLQEDFRQGIFAIKALIAHNRSIINELKRTNKENKKISEQLNSLLSENKSLKILKSKENDTQIKKYNSKKDINLNLRDEPINKENIKEENYKKRNYSANRKRNDEKQIEQLKKNNYEVEQLSNVKDIMDNMKKNKLKLKMAIEQHFTNFHDIESNN